MKFRFSKWSVYIVIASSVLLFLMLIFFVIICFYPILSVSNKFDSIQNSRFVTHWPFSSLEKENLERKRLRRYSQTEQKRRIEKQLQRMENINSPVYDLFLDQNVEIVTSQNATFMNELPFFWPLLPGKKSFLNLSDPSSYRKSSQVIFPSQHSSGITEGVLLLGGEEIKANIPVSKTRRSLSFSIFVLTPGSLRVSLGQYVWAKTFTNDDIQKRININIPLNDFTATNIRIISISSSLYLLNANISQLEKNARIPIRVSLSSSLWTYDKQNLKNEVKQDNRNDPLKNDESGVADEQDQEILSEQKNEELRQEEDLQNQNSIAVTDKNQKKMPLPDPLTQITNAQIVTKSNYTTAFGYNILVIQAPKVSDYFMKDKVKLSKIAPTLLSLIEQSVEFSRNIRIEKDPSETFRNFIYFGNIPLNSDNIDLVKERVDDEKNKNIYFIMRKYGYKVLGLANSEAFYFQNQLSHSSQYMNLYGKWLEYDDWSFVKKNLQIDDKNTAATGLEAIFKVPTKDMISSLKLKDFQNIGSYLSDVSQNIDTIPDWNPSEYILVDNKELFTPKVIDSFQNWMQENQYSRFFAHVLLDNSNIMPERATLKDLMKAISALKLTSLISPTRIEDAASLSFLDRALKQMLDTLKARKVENRTIVFVLFPSDNKSSHLATGVFKIPGLIPKRTTNIQNISISDIVVTLLSSIGIPAGNNVENSNININGVMLEKNVKIETKLNNAVEKEVVSRFVKYTMLIKPNSNNCESFIWNVKNKKIFGLRANYPVYQYYIDKSIEFFPCSMKDKFINVTWYQKYDEDQNSLPTIENYLGGYFSYAKNIENLPRFYFGEKLTSFKNLVFSFDSLNKNEFNELFLVQENKLLFTKEKAKNSFFESDFLEKFDKKNPFKNETKIALFLTPL